MQASTAGGQQQSEWATTADQDHQGCFEETELKPHTKLAVQKDQLMILCSSPPMFLLLCCTDELWWRQGCFPKARYNDQELAHGKSGLIVPKIRLVKRGGFCRQRPSSNTEHAQTATKCLIICFFAASSPEQVCSYLYLAQRASYCAPNARTSCWLSVTTQFSWLYSTAWRVQLNEPLTSSRPSMTANL